ncbi:MAG: tRNA (adenosine(37)-N6)-threonylcarbamoyltransferase complex ATPase subunit type 1 TsaE [Planctomycetota bacterium]|nr:MAG: tRNA (adenosine(37)-N6)-threonylcarbamoyltransferase complex ATPase subunit type 1 TsaE [Planctomycetota bacterium]
MDFKIVSNSAAETIELGRKIGSKLRGGEIIAVCGALGSGKTHLIKGIAGGAGAKDSRHVTSPTFVIVNEYTGRLNIYHIDAYRLDSMQEFEMIGFDDYCGAESVVLVEWADKIEQALEGIDYIRIELFHSGQNQRRMHVRNAPLCL